MRWRSTRLSLGLLAGVLLGACVSVTPTPTAGPPPVPSATRPLLQTAPPASSPPAGARGRYFQRILIIVMENKARAGVLTDAYFAGLAGRGTQLTNYSAVAHPSQPNYLALLAGAPLVTEDNAHDLPQTNLVDLLEPAGISWKAYLSDYPGQCFTGTKAGGLAPLYVRKHNPFVSFDDIRTNPARCARIVSGAQFPADLAADELPTVMFYIPNLQEDTHDASLAAGAAWLQGFLEPKLSDPRFSAGTLIVVTFDESDGSSAGNEVYTVLLGPLVTAGAGDATAYTHYSLLRTLEDNFNLGTLGRAEAQTVPFAACNFTGGCGQP